MGLSQETLTKWRLDIVIPAIAVLGLIDSFYLVEIYSSPDICSTTQTIFSFTIDCGSVARSEYASIAGIPLAIIGVIYYLTVLLLFLFREDLVRYIERIDLVIMGILTGAFVFSLYLTYLQMFVIFSVCLYCLGSALSTTLLLATSYLYFTAKP